jgi:starch phosphorylase
MTHVLNGFIRSTHVAYFTMEIALRNEIHSYAGGLGVLAGDMARSCADLHIPVVFVSLVSREGYLRQEIGQTGQQLAFPDPWEPQDWAMPLAAMVAIELAGRMVWIRPWLYVLNCPQGHQVPVILLDTDLEQNSPADREITDRLYGGDETHRLKQEAVLGIGGIRILQALGFEIRKYHLNEGHAALLTIELLRRYRRADGPIPITDALYDDTHVREQCIFTTHTPVDVGHDQFAYSIVERVLGDFIELSELQRYAGTERCNMTRLALNLSGYVNGVAPRHAETTRAMFPGYAVEAISNGIHTGSWAHRAFARLYDTHFPRWWHEPEVLMHADQLDDAAVWDARREAKADLIAFVKDKTGTSLELDVPLIGFARRMTGYKRPELLLADIGRLRSINRARPFQAVWAGKAHPKDAEGARSIESINRHIRELAGDMRMAFLPNYDLETAHRLVSGTDVWLNTPLPPLEASGTSGMKAAVNGGLNLSVLDGWWLEAWIEGVTGWSIGEAGLASAEHQSEALYKKLEERVLPLYYDERARWIWMMKQSISKIACHFSSQRMMRRYATEAYLR